MVPRTKASGRIHMDQEEAEEEMIIILELAQEGAEFISRAAWHHLLHLLRLRQGPQLVSKLSRVLDNDLEAEVSWDL